MPDGPQVVFYIGAHQDDWQLFMAPQAYHDLIADQIQVVFIYTTAGDAGGDRAWARGRTAGALSSIQFARHLPLRPVAPDRCLVNGHPIPRYTIATTRSYCLNLPDGNADGRGFAATGRQSLHQLRQGTLPAIAALVDTPEYHTQYPSWQDVVTTLRAIIEHEAPDETPPPIPVHLLDPAVTHHADHTVTGLAVAEALGNSPRYQQVQYEEYRTPELPANVEGVELVRKAGLYLFYAQTAFELSGRLEHLDDWHLSFVPRQYRTR